MQCNVPFGAKIILLGCIIALSAVIGFHSTLLALARSMMTTWFCSLTFSHMHMKWVKVCKVQFQIQQFKGIHSHYAPRDSKRSGISSMVTSISACS